MVMTGLNKLPEKDRRRVRRSFKVQKERNPIARDLAEPKYHQRVIERKRSEDFQADRFYEDEVDW